MAKLSYTSSLFCFFSNMLSFMFKSLCNSFLWSETQFFLIEGLNKDNSYNLHSPSAFVNCWVHVEKPQVVW